MKTNNKLLIKEALELFNSGITSPTEVAKRLKKKHDLTEDVRALSNKIRYHFGKKKESYALYDYCKEVGIDPTTVTKYYHKGDGKFTLIVDNTTDAEEFSLLKVSDEIIDKMKKGSKVIRKVRRTKCKDPHLLVIDIADLHVSKYSKGLGDDYNTKVAVKRAIDGVKGILDKTSGFGIDQILFVAGNDVLHHDGKGTTTKGTPQDFDVDFFEAFSAAKDIYIEILRMLIGVAPVHYVHCMSNHDFFAGFFLSQCMEAYFSKCKDITFDNGVQHRKYYRYGSSLIGLTHGDRAKWNLLPSLMSVEAKTDWANTDHKYVYTHHIHHKTMAKDFIGVTVESLRSPSGTDTYHHEMGYVHAPKAVEGFLHSKKHGQVARITHIFN